MAEKTLTKRFVAPNPDDHVVGVRAYRSRQIDGAYVEVVTVAYQVGHNSITFVADVPAYFKLSFIDAFGNESTKSSAFYEYLVPSTDDLITIAEETETTRPAFKIDEDRILRYDPRFIDQIRLMDELMLTVGKSFTIDGHPVPAVFATPERAFGTMTEIHGVPHNEDSVTLPAISVFRSGDLIYDMTRAMPEAPFRPLSRSDDGNKVHGAGRLLPITLEYQFDFWSKYVSEGNQFLQQSMLNFGRFSTVKFLLCYDDVMKMPVMLSDLVSLTDNSDLEPGEGQRQVRKTLTMVLQSYLIKDFYELPTVRKVTVDGLLWDDPSTVIFHSEYEE